MEKGRGRRDGGGNTDLILFCLETQSNDVIGFAVGILSGDANGSNNNSDGLCKLHFSTSGKESD